MKLNTNRIVEGGLTGVMTHTIGIEANGKAFRALVDGLYSNKIRAFVREISTNAFDSHIEAGRADEPFHVSLPDTFDPYFRVRDYGVGMTHDDVVNVFGTLFRSTKDDTNEVVGAFGLGSKSPLSYADSFTVTATGDGMERVYYVTIDAEGAPTISLLGEVVTDKPTGIEVAVPIDPTDFGNVTREARDVLQWFDPVPTVVGADIEAPKTLVTNDAGNVSIIASHDDWLFVKQGCVVYPVNEWEINRKVQGRLSYGYSVLLDVPIGTVGVTVSRESIELDEETRIKLIDMIEEGLTEVEDAQRARVDALPNFLTAVQQAHHIERMFQNPLTYKGQRLHGWVSLEPWKGEDPEPLRVRSENKRALSTLTSIALTSAQSSLFVIERTAEGVKRGKLRYRTLVENENRPCYLLTDPTSRQLERLVRLFGLTPDQIIPLSTLPDPGHAPRGARKGTGAIQGVKTLEGGEVTELPDEWLWIEGTRLNKWGYDRFRYQWEELNDMTGDALPCFVVTPSARNRLKVQAGNNLTTRLRVAHSAKTADYKRAMELYYLGIASKARTALGIESHDESDYSAAQTWLTTEQREEAAQAAQERTEAIKAKYPLIAGMSISTEVSDAHLQEYIAWCDEKSAETA